MIEVLKQMVEALEWCHGGEPVGTADAIKAGKKLIAELENQEPVAWLCKTDEYGLFDFPTSDKGCKDCFPVFTHPPQRSESSGKPSAWVGLTDDDKVLINHDANFNQFMTVGEYADRVQQLTEARLKDKNT